MPSHLTRHVFRRLLANEPIVSKGCLRRQTYTCLAGGRNGRRATVQSDRQPSRCSARHVPDRTMFNMGFLKKKPEATVASLAPGLDVMMDLEKRQRMNARLPSREDVAGAVHRFCQHCKENRNRIEDNQAVLLLLSIRHCLHPRKHDTERTMPESPSVPPETLTLVVNALSYSVHVTTAHAQLGKSVYDAILPFQRQLDTTKAFRSYVRCLALSGSTREALQLILEYEQSGAAAATSSEHAGSTPEVEDEADAEPAMQASQRNGDHVQMWGDLLQGSTLRDSATEVTKIVNMVLERNHRSKEISTNMLIYSLKSDDLASAQKWVAELQRTQQPQQTSNARSYRLFLDWCLRHGEVEAGYELIQQLITSYPSKATWDMVFVWAAGNKKGVDEIDRMMTLMVQSNHSHRKGHHQLLPDVKTINALVESAISQEDPYTAERFIGLGRKWEIEPDARTYALQMDYRLKVTDIDGALVAYKNLQGMDLSSNEDVPTVNKLIVALCGTKRHDFDTIMNVAADLSDRRVRFEAETVAALSLLHLGRDERHDVIDLLNTHAYHYSTAERDTVRTAIFDFSLDPATPTSRAWDGYTLLREIFDETPRTQRTALMNAFFLTHNRSDMGVHIFQNMRMHSRTDTIPTIDTYVSAFMSLARMVDIDALEIVHNQLKLDFNIDKTTYLLNALIASYTACGKPRKALDFWDEIVASREGPSYNSVHVALRACEKAPFGDLKAHQLWSRLQHRGVELDNSLWASYAGALAGNGDNELAIGALEEGVEKGEVELDAFVVGSLFMAANNVEKQKEVEVWAREKCAGIWKELEGRGWETNIAGMRTLLGLDRSVAL